MWHHSFNSARLALVTWLCYLTIVQYFKITTRQAGHVFRGIGKFLICAHLKNTPVGNVVHFSMQTWVYFLVAANHGWLTVHAHHAIYPFHNVDRLWVALSWLYTPLWNMHVCAHLHLTTLMTLVIHSFGLWMALGLDSPPDGVVMFCFWVKLWPLFIGIYFN